MSEQIDPRFKLRGGAGGGRLWNVEEVDRISLSLELSRLRQELEEEVSSHSAHIQDIVDLKDELEEAKRDAEAIAIGHEAVPALSELRRLRAQNKGLVAALREIRDIDISSGKVRGPLEMVGRAAVKAYVSKLAAKALEESEAAQEAGG